MQKSKIFILGLILGISITSSVSLFKNGNHQYVTLEKDYEIVGVGKIKKGTILKVDTNYPEGFTRYILFLNAKGEMVTNYLTNQSNKIIPYWLNTSTNVSKGHE